MSTDTKQFCRNEFNITGLCNRFSCPLANSQYATVREKDGRCILYIRTAERAFFPEKQWQKITLSKDRRIAMRQIDENLVFWPSFYRRKCKERILMITRYIKRVKNLKLNPGKMLVPIHHKSDKINRIREKKALLASKLDTVIENKLMERLKDGTYGEIYNFPEKAFEENTREAKTQMEEMDSYVTADIDEDMDEEEDIEEGEKTEVVKKKLERFMDKELEKEEKLEKIKEARKKKLPLFEEDDENFEDFEDEVEEEEEVESEVETEYIADFEESDGETAADIEDSLLAEIKQELPFSSAQLRQSLWRPSASKGTVKIEYDEEEVEEERQKVRSLVPS